VVGKSMLFHQIFLNNIILPKLLNYCANLKKKIASWQVFSNARFDCSLILVSLNGFHLCQTGPVSSGALK
jgi:hypothetical protein